MPFDLTNKWLWRSNPFSIAFFLALLNLYSYNRSMTLAGISIVLFFLNLVKQPLIFSPICTLTTLAFGLSTTEAGNVINSSNRFVYSVMEAMYRLCEPSLNLVRRYIPNFGTIDISPIVVYLGLMFIKSLLIEYWPR